MLQITAVDEHRANFEMVNISSAIKTSPGFGKKGGIEMSLPVLHCDVGGSYVEGCPDNTLRIDGGRSEGGLM